MALSTEMQRLLSRLSSASIALFNRLNKFINSPRADVKGSLAAGGKAWSYMERLTTDCLQAIRNKNALETEKVAKAYKYCCD
jgi:hypothetical protein